ncbi:hypothetical protein Pla123a_29430 [Posidoniimonas polymericola]|uniref:IPT/TIG domain protein n=1 Tax=Posidoniimonas polymericola TaxID=2528002 RepID=A0A5C5YMK1_9BACT|nr:hypothetical protein [Posidoniimonas polymericola]TWT76154.1 hypothetical protein Pla123a_29430 [Posidoniimonas polymericola]
MYRSTLAALLLAALSSSAATAHAGGCSGGGGRPIVYPRPIYHPVVRERVVVKPVVHERVVAAKPAPQQPAPPAAPLPTVVSGSRLILDGMPFGRNQGSVEMKVGPLTMPVKVDNWNAQVVRIRMPEMDLDLALPAKLTVRRADGSLVTEKQVQLIPATPRLALNK